MKKPRIFISSTVFDFSDLRSAIKYWLEEMGFEVQLSEYNDFDKDLLENSYDACLKNIETCQYYILLIGSRVGGYYEYKKTSITQKEYQFAYELTKSNKIKIITFVRKELWNIKNDRKALEKYIKENILKQYEIPENELENIIGYKSDFVNNAEFIFKFIDEVCRKEEMTKAIKGVAKFPIQNWVHQFSGFKDIIDVLKISLNTNKNLTYNIHLLTVEKQIKENLSHFFIKSEKNIFLKSNLATSAFNEIKDNKEFDFKTHKIKGISFKRLIHFALITGRVSSSISTKFIEKAIYSGDFLEYDHVNNLFKEGLLLTKLIDLVNEYYNLIYLHKIHQENLNITLKYADLVNAYKDNIKYEIPSAFLLLTLSIYTTHLNIVNLSKFILSLLLGKTELNEPNIIISPVPTLSTEIEQEQVTIKDIEEYLLKN